jgi:ABC-type transporter Mla MlaB component
MLSPHMMDIPDMTITLDKNVMMLQGKIHFGNVADILAVGNQLLDTLPALQIHLTHLHDSDSSGLALLCAWLRKARTEHKALSFKKVPAFIQDIARVYGLDKVLNHAWEN